MRIHPDLRALRGDDSPQCDAQADMFHAVAGWRRRADIAALLAELGAFDETGVAADCPVLASLFDPEDDAAAKLAGSFAHVVSDRLARSPLGHVPLRHFTDGVLSTLVLARSGNVTLSLVALDGDGLAGRPAPVTADFSPSEVWERILAGSGWAQSVERVFSCESEALLDCRETRLHPGKVICRDARRQALLVREVEGCLVSLRLQRRLRDAGPTREYDLSSSKLVHQAAGNPRDSRIELMMALIGRMKRGDAAPMLGRIAQEKGSTALRWQALRECLALDTEAGFRALSAIARSESDELAPAAGALRSQLIESYPQLKELDACHA